MDIKKLKKLIELLEESKLAELEISEGDYSVKLSKGTNQYISSQTPANISHANISKEINELPKSNNDSITSQVSTPKSSGHNVKSPMVGTFYRSPSPDAKNFVEVGDTVSEGDTLCIVEAMKMFNQIEADKSGVVRSIEVENAQPVEYDQVLFVIE